MAEHQRHLALVTGECGFRYLRFHGLLHDDMAVYTLDSRENPVLNFQYVDLLFDHLRAAGIKPFVELGFMPPALASGPETVFWWKGNVTLPRSMDRWQDLVRDLVLHWVRRYGRDEVRTWYFEVWNEPNLRDFFAGSMEDYFRLYAATARVIKEVDPDFRVGGPASAGAEWIPELIGFCHEENVPLDFVSTHTYGVQGFLDEFGTHRTRLDPDPASVIRDVEKIHRQVRESSMPGLEIHFTEWSTSYSPADPVHDAYHSAAWMLAKIKRCEGLLHSLSWWTFTDIFEEPGPPRSHFHGGFGLLTTQGLRKPAFFAYKYLHGLGSLELENADADSWVCTDGQDIQVLFWDCTHTGAGLANQDWYTRDLPPGPAGQARLELSGLEPGVWQLEARCTGYGHNDVYSGFLGLKVEGSLSPAQVERLHDLSSDPVGETRTFVLGEGDRLSWTRELAQNEVVMAVLRKVQ